MKLRTQDFTILKLTISKINVKISENLVHIKYNFIDPKSGCHTQTVERMWDSATWRNEIPRDSTPPSGVILPSSYGEK